VDGIRPSDPERLFEKIGYCTQFDTYPRGIRGWDFVHLYLKLHGLADDQASARTQRAIERVGMSAAASRRIAGYSKGMKQRIKLAQAIATSRRCCSSTSRSMDSIRLPGPK